MSRFTGETTKERSDMMRKIHNKDTSIEVKLRKALWHNGIRYRKQYKIPFLKRRTIDIAITKYKVAVFCDSSFFHGKDQDVLFERLEKGSNPSYWTGKIKRNIERDIETDRLLREDGWLVIRFWQEEIDCDISRCVGIVEEAILEQHVSTISGE